MHIEFIEHAAINEEQRRLNDKVTKQMFDSMTDPFTKRIFGAWCQICDLFNKTIQKRKPTKSKNARMFCIRFKNKIFTIFIEPPWAAEVLGLDKEMMFYTSKPEEVLQEITDMLKEIKTH